MDDLHFREQGPPETYDNTMLSTWTTCPRRLYWFLRGLDYKIIPPYFTFGRAWGAAVNYWHVSQGSGKEPMQRYVEALQLAEREWNKDNTVGEGDNSFENLRKLLELYIENYGPEEPWTMVYETGELGFELPVPGTNFYYGGSLDAPIQWKPYGILAREDKTTGSYITDAYMQQWDLATQVKGYFWAFREILPEEPYGSYMNIASKRHRKDPADRFSRHLVRHDPWEIDEFLRDTILLVDDIRREWDRWQWPKLGMRNQINCVGGMGRSACPYKRLCLIDADPWQLEDDYPFDKEFYWRDVWAPWKREGENE